MRLRAAFAASVVLALAFMSAGEARAVEIKTASRAQIAGLAYEDGEFETDRRPSATPLALDFDKSEAMVQLYFDADAFITLGVLALACAAFAITGVSAARRRGRKARNPSPREPWRDEVMRALEADLAQFGSRGFGSPYASAAQSMSKEEVKAAGA